MKKFLYLLLSILIVLDDYMVKISVAGETKNEKFRRITEARTRKTLYTLKLLENCSNISTYEYSDEEVNVIFTAIEKETKRVKSLFKKSTLEQFNL
ncbi:MAG: hypothetical protein QXS93_00620 [Candidatus Micrarchaeia archaeon]